MKRKCKIEKRNIPDDLPTIYLIVKSLFRKSYKTYFPKSNQAISTVKTEVYKFMNT